MTELAAAATAAEARSSDLLAPITAMAAVPTDPSDMVAAIDDDEELYALIMAGWTVTQVAHHQTKKTGRRWLAKDVDDAVQRVGRSNLARTSSQLAFAAQLELDRIESSIKAIWLQAQGGNLMAIDRVVKLSEAKRKLLGLDAADVKVLLTMGGQDALDFSALSTEELQTLQALQRKASSAAKARVVEGRVILDG